MTEENPGNPKKRRGTARRVFLDPSSPPAASIVRVVIITLIILAVKDFLGGILSSLTYLFFMIVLSVFFAYLIDPLVKFIRRPFKVRNLEKLMPRALAIVIAYVVVFTVVGLSIASLAPRIAAQATEFARNVPDYALAIQNWVSAANDRFNQLNISKEVQDAVNTQITTLIESGSRLIVGTFATGLALNLISYVPWLILVPVLSFFFLKDVNLFRTSLLRIFPSGRWRARAESVLTDVNLTLAAYTRAQLISCLIIGFICTVGFYLLGVKYSLLFGILAGVLEFIPLLGPLTIGLAVTIITAFGDDPARAFWVMVFLVVLRVAHDYITYPRIVREGIKMHPLVIILSVLAGEQVAGIPGVFLSIPVVALITVFYRHILEHRGTPGIFTGWLEKKE